MHHGYLLFKFNTKYNYQYTDTWYLSILIIDKYNGQVSDLKFVSRFSISIFPFTWWTLNLLSFEANDKKWLSVLFRFIWSFVYRSLIVSLYQRTSTNIQKLTLNSWLSWRIEAKMLRNSTEISRGTSATPSQIKTKQENSNFQDFRDF